MNKVIQNKKGVILVGEKLGRNLRHKFLTNFALNARKTFTQSKYIDKLELIVIIKHK